MMHLLLVVALAQAATGDTGGCHPDRVLRVLKERNAAAPFVVRLASGRQLRIAGQDFIDPRKWRRDEAVLICPSDQGDDLLEVINTQRGERLVTWPDARPR
jgi:hypothetical protein